MSLGMECMHTPATVQMSEESLAEPVLPLWRCLVIKLVPKPVSLLNHVAGPSYVIPKKYLISQPVLGMLPDSVALL